MGMESDDKMSDEEYAEFNEQKRMKLEYKEMGNPPKWPAKDGIFLMFCGFLFGLCSEDKFKEYMIGFGINIGLNEHQMDYLFFMFKVEQNLEQTMEKMSLSN